MASESDELARFIDKVRREGERLYRDLPWRRTRDPYAVWVSEAMLQQTQVSRVDGRWQRWLARFPSVEALAAADQADVLAEWQGLGYNRRALALKRAAEAVADQGGEVPSSVDALVKLPGIGPATAAGIRAFAFDLPAVYLETNVRTVFLHELFPEAEDVPDSAVRPLVEACVPDRDVRGWYYALLDYGAWLKRTVPNPSRRSRTHARQSRFEGSRRQKRAALVRLLLEAREAGLPGLSLDDAVAALGAQETGAGRPEPAPADVEGLLDELAAEGFCQRTGLFWAC
ncbi:adenine glycosylase [Olsenella sp. YH-ols2217]|uniref:Adenine glycosylase n=1 Tax=Kribbibacterium absianum TaxID=3044210 RepID=A0ABT6ZJ61_9ACTN|nr:MULTISPECIES: adenine glycosylase [unclassified Olsenella]MDJ1122647.1 adenine glycosylase [Olsenella sp. YH-ols2216]MDJ1129085.1 adenine glycosylase [Olsenella sp. YH-ols2217]